MNKVKYMREHLIKIVFMEILRYGMIRILISKNTTNIIIGSILIKINSKPIQLNLKYIQFNKPLKYITK